ncbi:MAG: UPF0280 family protein [Candidatus Omnitrophota bacterium]
MHEERFYRHWVKSQDLVNFEVVVEETDLYISAKCDLADKTKELVLKYRKDIKDYIKKNPLFATSLVPVDIKEPAPAIVKEMIQAAGFSGVGPMAAIAGAIAEFVGMELLKLTGELIIENGGDIFIKSLSPRKIGIYAGKSGLTGGISIDIIPENMPMGVCTSSGSVGHSLSFGKADAAIILSKSAALADAAATAVCNKVKIVSDIKPAIEFAKSISGVEGVVIILGDKIGVWGDVKLV